MTKSTKSDGKPVDDISILRDIILGEEKDRLRQLDRRVSDIESRTADVAEVLPAAMERLVDDPVSQPEFERPVVDTIRSAIKRDTASFAEALFPVLGPAIRRAVADALKGLVQRINVALENSLTIKGLSWRLEAARTGLPFAQIALRHTMLYAVQEAFLIQRGSGLILASVHRDELLALDEDAVAAMLTAIQSFIQDSLGISSDEPLRSAELGERTLWIVNGPSAVLACVISGTPPSELRSELMGLVETIHAHFGQRLNDRPDGLDGDEGLQSLMKKALLEEADEHARKDTGSRNRIMWIAGGVLILLYVLFTSVNVWRDGRFVRQVKTLFEQEPGYVITAMEMDDGILNIRGLRDPGTEQPAVLLDKQQIPGRKVKTDFRPYQSLENLMVTGRIKQRFDLDSSVSLKIDGDVLNVTGPLSSSQLAGLQQLPEFHALIRRLDTEGVRFSAEEASGMFSEALQAPDSVSFLPEDFRMTVTGSATPRWYTMAREIEVEVPGWQLDFLPLETNLSAQLDEVIQRLDGLVFQYSDGTSLTDESESKLDATATELVLAQHLATALGADLTVNLEGSGDGVGSHEKNIKVAMARSRHLLAELVARGVSEAGTVHSMAPWNEGIVDPELRKVTLSIKRDTRP